METVVLAFFIFALVMVAMAVGVLLSDRSIKGSCGGLNDIDGLSGSCDICELKSKCQRRKQAA
ncbi:MAG: (Na+)-NQR maturation NqrM [Pseudomonadota bacterium]